MAKKELFDIALQKKSEIAKVLSHPARLSIIEFLSQQSACIPTELVDHLDLNRGTVKQHLDELKKVEWVKSTTKEDKLVWCLNPKKMNADIEQLSLFVKKCQSDSNCC